ncbi:predicted protein [Pyrenophora tritici-repentis Pt-1C-BFP]|uniref:Uncharacterized protein n=1 Tax=Pyrenophora tritici-repentis (strain Pt-1C-BFP) TaxID=426418 RepID=B2W0S6_PYRTR|nr:uncharacterized protein PTRG_04061 [Pyrenophora tritici-repentis Pt-1C-BFP]EDU46899.1 predicted protein [Pyrenophora tritici-repentis Pt-1C-BFP]
MRLTIIPLLFAAFACVEFANAYDPLHGTPEDPYTDGIRFDWPTQDECYVCLDTYKSCVARCIPNEWWCYETCSITRTGPLIAASEQRSDQTSYI